MFQRSLAAALAKQLSWAACACPIECLPARLEPATAPGVAAPARADPAPLVRRPRHPASAGQPALPGESRGAAAGGPGVWAPADTPALGRAPLPVPALRGKSLRAPPRQSSLLPRWGSHLLLPARHLPLPARHLPRRCPAKPHVPAQQAAPPPWLAAPAGPAAERCSPLMASRHRSRGSCLPAHSLRHMSWQHAAERGG